MTRPLADLMRPNTIDEVVGQTTLLGENGLVRRMVDNKNKERYEIFNVGTGRAVSVFELVKTFERVNNLKLNYKVAPRRAGDVVAVWADTTLANTELGWVAERPLEKTLQAAWAWEKRVRNIK